MMDIERDERIRQRAYQLWEEAGRPEGADHQHWHQAAGEIGDGGGGIAEPPMPGEGQKSPADQPDLLQQAQPATRKMKSRAP